jgi:hypothetical protein
MPKSVLTDAAELFMRKTLKNVGYVDAKKTIIRSGQPENTLKFQALYKLFPFKTVINLAWSPATDDDDSRERKFCIENGIAYYKFKWGAGVPLTEKYANFWNVEYPEVVKLIDEVEKPLWIHCEGGRDRTGGLVAGWKLKHGYKLDEIFSDFCKYGMPNYTWLHNLWAKKEN